MTLQPRDAIGRSREPVIGEQRRRVVGVAPKVIVAHPVSAVGAYRDCRNERRHASDGIDANGGGPRQPTVERARKGHAVAHASTEARVLPHRGQLAVRTGGNRAQDGAVAYLCMGLGIESADRLHRRDDDGRRPAHALVGRTNDRKGGGGRRVGWRVESREKIDQGSVRENHDLIVDRLAVRARIIDRVRDFPGDAAIGSAAEISRAAASAAYEPVPQRVYQTRVGRIGGDRLLVVEKNCTVANQRNRVAPCRAAVGRATDQNRARRPRGEHLAVERKRALIDRTVGRESDPGIRRARVIAAVRGASAGATRERGHVLGPCPSSIE